jgi:hypothetical protein
MDAGINEAFVEAIRVLAQLLPYGVIFLIMMCVFGHQHGKNLKTLKEMHLSSVKEIKNAYEKSHQLLEKMVEGR